MAYLQFLAWLPFSNTVLLNHTGVTCSITKLWCCPLHHFVARGKKKGPSELIILTFWIFRRFSSIWIISCGMQRKRPSGPCWVFFPLHIHLLHRTSKNINIFGTSVLLIPVQAGLVETGCYTHRKQDCVKFASIKKYTETVYFIHIYVYKEKSVYGFVKLFYFTLIHCQEFG